MIALLLFEYSKKANPNGDRIINSLDVKKFCQAVAKLAEKPKEQI